MIVSHGVVKLRSLLQKTFILVANCNTLPGPSKQIVNFSTLSELTKNVEMYTISL